MIGITCHVEAQYTIKGKITESRQGSPAAGATITLYPLNKHTSSDADGYYRFHGLAAGNYLVKISYLGFAVSADSIRLTQDKILNYTINVKDKLLEGALVVGNAAGGYRVHEAGAGPMGKVSLKDIPYSIHVTSGELMENRNAHTLADALQTNATASVLMVSNTYSSLSRVMIRGFAAADQNELRDGLVDRSFTLPPVENVDRIEVQNGVTGFLYGFSEPGGVVNYVSKLPTARPMAAVTAGMYGGGIKYVHADVGGPLDSGRLGYRFNVYREQGSTYIDQGNQERTLVSGVLDYRVFGNTHLKADIYQQDYTVNGLQTYFSLNSTNPAVPDAFDGFRQYGQPWTYNQSEKMLMGIGAESKINASLSLRAAWRYGTMWRKYCYIAATLPDSTGSYRETYWATPRQNEDTHSAYVLADADVNTGPLHHRITAGYTSTSYLYQRGADINQLLGTSHIADPVAFAIPAYAEGLTTSQMQSMTSLIAADRITLLPALTVLAGVNYASIRQKAWGTNTGISTSNYIQHRLSPGFGLVWRPEAVWSVYASYTQGITAGGTAPASAANANRQLSPDVGDQWEAGAKTTIGGLDLSVALFRIRQINEYTDPQDNVYKQDGREVHQGVEVMLNGKIAPGLTFIGGGTLLRARVTRARNNTAIEGKIPLNVPEQQARAYLEYVLPGVAGLTVSAGVNYNGRRPVTSTDAAYLPAATTGDAGIRYETRALAGRDIKLGLNLQNVTNRQYWINYRNGDGLELGTPRILALNLGVKL